MTDDIVRWVAVGVLSGAFLLGLVGGLLTPVGGVWRDGDRRVTLKQRGPFVQGRCPRPGGGEIYKGWAWFGLVRLRRHEYGRDHLLGIGFGEDAVPLVDGACMGHLRFRRRGDRLEGTFEGRKFSFGGEPTRVLSVALLTPATRVWERT